MLNTIKLVGMVSVEEVKQYANDAANRKLEYMPALAFWYDAYRECRRLNLRYDRKRNILRDDNGVLARPASPADWPVATCEEAVEALCRKVWSVAVRKYNRNQWHRSNPV